MILVETKDFKWKGFGVNYTQAITDEGDIIKGGGLYLFGKNRMTIAFANTLWINEVGRPHWCRIEKGALFFFNMALSFKGR